MNDKVSSRDNANRDDNDDGVWRGEQIIAENFPTTAAQFSHVSHLLFHYEINQINGWMDR